METILTAIGIGLLATTSPCVFPLYPGFLAYIGGGPVAPSRAGRYTLGVFVLAGVLTMMLALGALIAALSVSVGRALSLLVPLADGLIVLLGVLLLLGANPFKALPQVRVPALSHPFANAFVYGLLYGPIALPCAGPLLVGLFAFSLTATEFVSKLGVFLGFGFGFGLPLLALSFLSGAAQRVITRAFARHSRAINRASGSLLVGVGAYDLWSNWTLISAYLA
ncbi:MAG: cytochrome C biogenesis protein [Chloroflexi bacterium]|nr:cytochrome C biogenesis protein [Chloroflexota bacterium]